MIGWLAARDSGVTGFRLRWLHDAMRPKAAAESGELTVRTAKPTRDVEHLTRLLAEHLAKVQLLAPVGDLELGGGRRSKPGGTERHSFSGTRARRRSLALVLERIAARLGPERVLRPVVLEVTGEAATRHVERDYWVALSQHAGVLRVFQSRLVADEAAWFLHGTFA